MTSWFFRKTEGPPCPHRRCGGPGKCAFSSAEEYRTCNAETGVQIPEGAPYAPLVQRQNIALVMRRSGVRISEGAPHTPLVQRKNASLIMGKSGVRISEGVPYALLAQLVEQRIDNPKITGSNPVERTISTKSGGPHPVAFYCQREFSHLFFRDN